MRAITILVAIGILVGCGGKPQAPPMLTEENPIVLPERPVYKIGVGDILLIKFFYYPNYDIDVTVRPDGMVTIPLVGEVKAEGMTPLELEQVIRAKYAEILVEPEVSVIVRYFAQQRVFVFGEVRNPGAIAYSGAMTIIDAIASAGGHSTSAKLGSVILMRRQPDGNYVGSRLNLQAMLEGKEPKITYLMPQDIVYVPMSNIAKVNVFVEQFFARITPAWLFMIYGREAIERTGNLIIRD